MSLIEKYIIFKTVYGCNITLVGNIYIKTLQMFYISLLRERVDK